MSEKISEIKGRYETCGLNDLPAFIESIKEDERAGVKKIAESAKKSYNRYQQELVRLEEMKHYEKKYDGEKNHD